MRSRLGTVRLNQAEYRLNPGGDQVVPTVLFAQLFTAELGHQRHRCRELHAGAVVEDRVRRVPW
jgi:hypothetical protein